jgi:hypothetical protein
MTYRRIPALLLVCASLACGDSSGPSAPSMTGTWSGNTSAGGVPFTFSMTVTAAGQQVSGNGQFMVQGGGSVVFTVAGNHVHPNVSLTIMATGSQDAIYTGSFTNNSSISGQLNGSGFVNVGLTLNRQ